MILLTRNRDSWNKSPKERQFLHRLDACLLTYAALSYFSKYLDQQNVIVSVRATRGRLSAFNQCVNQNAYVSGMKEEYVNLDSQSVLRYV